MRRFKLSVLIIVTALTLNSCAEKNSKMTRSIVEHNIISKPKLFTNTNGINVISETLIIGEVHNWITDTVYLITLPFHSPYSYQAYYQIITKDSSFQFNFGEIDKPLIFQISPIKKSIDRNINDLLFDNLTVKHYFGQCFKYSTYEITTFLIEPNDSILVELNFNSWIEKLSDKKAKYLKSLGVQVSDDNTVRDYGKTGLTFFNPNKWNLEYYQKWFGVDDKYDSKVETSKNIENAYKDILKLKEKLLSDLQQEKLNITPFLYKHLRASIEFSAKKEFLKHLILEDKNYLKGKVPNEIIEFIEFDKNDIDYPTILSDQYNDYLEFYLTYKINKEKGSSIVYKEFDKEKFDFVMSELPKNSQYYYLANQLLHQENSADNKDLSIQLIEKYSKGDLNEKLMQKFQ